MMMIDEPIIKSSTTTSPVPASEPVVAVYKHTLRQRLRIPKYRRAAGAYMGYSLGSISFVVGVLAFVFALSRYPSLHRSHWTRLTRAQGEAAYDYSRCVDPSTRPNPQIINCDNVIHYHTMNVNMEAHIRTITEMVGLDASICDTKCRFMIDSLGITIARSTVLCIGLLSTFLFFVWRCCCGFGRSRTRLRAVERELAHEPPAYLVN